MLITIARKDQPSAIETARKFSELGFEIRATEGTQKFLSDNGITATHINKEHEGRPNITDAITNGEIQLVINTPIGRAGTQDDSYIRKAAIKRCVPYITTLTAALAAAEGIKSCQKALGEVKSLQEYHADIK